MPKKKKKLYLIPYLSKDLTKYRNINQSTSYTPAIFNPEKYTDFQPPGITIVEEDNNNSKWE